MSDYTIAERYTLPSHGLLYEQEINPEIKLRSMTVRDEMRRLAPVTDGTLYRSMAEIIDDCLVEKPGISSYDMCVGDYQFLMHKLRIVTYGPEYKLEVRCPLCNDWDTYIVNLENLQLKELKEFDKEKELNLILPVSKKKIELNVTTPRMLDSIEKEVTRVAKQYKKQNKEISDIDWHLLYQLVYSVKTVDGQKLSVSDKETFCGKLVGRDYNAIINKLNALEEKVGLGATLEVHCNNCGYDMVTPFRLTSEFFRPTSTDQN